MSMMNRVARFARSRQGQQLFGQAKRYASSPKGRAKIDQVRRQLSQGRRPKGR
jgi:hypothetical protein